MVVCAHRRGAPDGATCPVFSSRTGSLAGRQPLITGSCHGTQLSCGACEVKRARKREWSWALGFRDWVSFCSTVIDRLSSDRDGRPRRSQPSIDARHSPAQAHQAAWSTAAQFSMKRILGRFLVMNSEDFIFSFLFRNCLKFEMIL
jgi:hypothetical protein